jgi:hypothetical protein
MAADALRPFRDTIDCARLDERAAFARTARNAVARAILTASLAADAADAAVEAPEREPPEAQIRALLGAEVGAELAELYRGGDDWTSRAIDLLAPLNELAHTG